jgi:hypothetical protein
MSKHRNQAQLYRQLHKELIRKIPQNARAQLTVQKVVTRIRALKSAFKKEFFSNETDEKKALHFAYYEKMNQMFVDFATRKLNETDTLNETTHEQISLMISGYLEEIAEDHQHSTSQQSKCEAIKSKILELPDESVLIQNENIKINPNTPFNRAVSQSLIPKQRNSLLNSYQQTQVISKRRLDSDPDFLPKNSTEILGSKIKKVNSTEVFNESREFVVEALDECEISNISVRHSKVIYNNRSSRGIHRGSSLPNCSRSKQLKDISNNTPKILNKDAKSDQQKLNKELQSTIQAISSDESIESCNSIMQIPSLNISPNYSFSNDISFGLRKNNSEKIVQVPNIIHDETVKSKDKAIVPKNLMKQVQDFSTSTNESLLQKLKNNPQISITCKENTNSAPPAWFKSFLAKYERDVKAINDKLDQIMSGNSLEQQVKFRRV